MVHHDVLETLISLIQVILLMYVHTFRINARGAQNPFFEKNSLTVQMSGWGKRVTCQRFVPNVSFTTLYHKDFC